MATGFTSSEMKENTMSRITSSVAINVAVRPIDGASGASGPHDETISRPLNNSSCGSKPTTEGVLPVTKNKKKHRRGKPKKKNTKPYKKTNWKFQVPRYGKSQSKGGYSVIGAGSKSYSNSMNARRPKLNRSRSLVPYNTNKFLMEEHLAEMPSVQLTPSTNNGRTRDSSFSVDSEDNYLYSLPEDEEEFLTKEFSNVYERARVERLEMLTKQQLIAECLQIEDRCSEQGAQGQQQVNVQKMSADFLAKIRQMEEKIRELTRENHELRRQLTTLTATVQNPTPMDSSSEDSESDSSSSSSSSNSGAGKSPLSDDQKPPDEMIYESSSSAEDPQPITDWNNYFTNAIHEPTPSTSSSSLSRCSFSHENGIVDKKSLGEMAFDTSSSVEDVEPTNDVMTEWDNYYPRGNDELTSSTSTSPIPSLHSLNQHDKSGDHKSTPDMVIDSTVDVDGKKTNGITKCDGYSSPDKHYHPLSSSSPSTSPGQRQEYVGLPNSETEPDTAEKNDTRPM